jgi:uncharacterized protein (TIGR04255 family)
MSQEIYAKAPIVEAIIDLQVRYDTEDASVLQKRFDDFSKEHSSDLPGILPISLFQMGLQRTPGVPNLQTNFGQSQVGLRLATVQNDRVLQVQQRGFTFSHMPPYTEWTTFRKEALAYWDSYIKICGVRDVTRLALRYINRIVINQESIQLKDYFQIYPEMPKGMPDDITGYFMQVHIPQVDMPKESIAILNMALERPETPQTISVLLDFDIFLSAEYEAHSLLVWDYLDQLRDRKNKIFESCITDQTRGLIR